MRQKKREIERQIANGKESKTVIKLQLISNDTKRRKLSFYNQNSKFIVSQL